MPTQSSINTERPIQVGAGGTAASTFTTYGPVVAGATATSALTSVAPSATSGVPLVSQGAAANPTFGTASVSGGGTGATSFTAKGALFGNTTSAIGVTGALTDGKLMIGSTGGNPASANITAGTGITVVNGSNSIIISSTGGGGGGTVNAYSFAAYSAAGVTDVTGDGTAYYPVALDTVDFDANSVYNNTTYVFNAPVTGEYCFIVEKNLSGYLVGHTYEACYLRVNNTTDYLLLLQDPISLPTSTSYQAPLVKILHLTAGDTVGVKIVVNGSTKVVDVAGTNQGFIFSGYLVQAGTFFAWTDVTGTTANLSAQNGYYANNAGLVTLTLPATAALGTIIVVCGKGAGGWSIAQRAGQSIHYIATTSTPGVTGHLDSVAQYDSVTLVCSVADTDWTAIGGMGNLNIV